MYFLDICIFLRRVHSNPLPIFFVVVVLVLLSCKNFTAHKDIFISLYKNTLVFSFLKVVFQRDTLIFHFDGSSFSLLYF